MDKQIFTNEMDAEYKKLIESAIDRDLFCDPIVWKIYNLIQSKYLYANNENVNYNFLQLHYNEFIFTILTYYKEQADVIKKKLGPDINKFPAL
jgi:hypothetical protein